MIIQNYGLQNISEIYNLIHPDSMYIKKFIALILTVLTAIASLGQNPVDSMKVLFQISHDRYDPMLGDNRALTTDFIDKIRKAIDNNRIDCLVVNGYASPDGYNNQNLRLAKNRSQTIIDYIVNETNINTNLIRPSRGDIAWDELRFMVASTPNVPSREKVLNILDNTPVMVFDAYGRLKDSRKKRLMDLDGGNPYRWLLNNIFPQLQSVIVSLFYTIPNPDKSHENTDILTEPTANEKELVEEMDGTFIENKYCQNTADTLEAVVFKPAPLYRFALKTNMLYDVALMPNLELEWRINNQWSLAVEGDIAWWKKDSKHKYYQIAMVSSEVRRWFKLRNPWHGMYVGLFAGVGKYDLENGKNGYMGEGCMTGGAFGYMWPIGRNLSLETGIGAGYMYTRYKEYKPLDGHYLYQRTKSLNYFGPLKLKFSIAWRFNDINKHKENNPAQ